MSPITRPATDAELAWIAPAALRSRIVEHASELVAVHAAEPWRVRATDAGEAAYLDRWRPGLPFCAVLGLWCSSRRVPDLIADLETVACDHGFTRLLAPLVPEEAARPYLAAGLEVIERIVVMRVDPRATVRTHARERARSDVGRRGGVTIREAGEDDVPRIAMLDAASFEPFWRYDADLLRRLAASGRLAVAEEDGRIIGYTLATLHGVDGSLGRVAVACDSRGRGIGRELVAEAVAWMAGHGARTVVLSTQEGNEVSRSLYRGLGFAELPGRLVACASGPLCPQEER